MGIIVQRLAGFLGSNKDMIRVAERLGGTAIDKGTVCTKRPFNTL